MSTEIEANKGNLWGKIVLQIVIFSALCYFAYVLITSADKHIFRAQNVRDWGILVFLLVLNISGFSGFYSLITGVIIDEGAKMLVIKYQFLPDKSIRVGDIAGYSNTVVKTRSSGYQGIYIHLAGGKKILLSDLNLSDSFPVELFLSDSGVKKLNDE